MSQILGALFAILIGIISIPTYISYQNQSNENLRISATAKQAIIFNDASSAYAQQNAVAIQATATATVPAVITVAMMQATNNLDASFSATNAYGQTWQLQVLEPIAGSLQALAITTGGQALTDKVATRIATVIGSAGGFLPLNDSGIYPGGSANAYGAFGGFTVPTTNYTSITGGELASLLTFNNGQLVDNRLYRNAVPGQPQLNTMNTPLIMASTQALNGACATTGAIAQDGTGGILSCQGGVWKSPGDGKCQSYVGDLNTLQTDGRCYNGNGSTTSNLPFAGADWYFLEVYRHINTANYYTVQKLIGMTGLTVDKVWQRTQQSNTSGIGWGSWFQQADGKVTIWDQPTEGGVVTIKANDGTAMHIETIAGGKIRYLNSAWNREINSVDQTGNLTLDQNDATNASGTINMGWAVETWGCPVQGAMAKSAFNLVGGWTWNGEAKLTCIGGLWTSNTVSNKVTVNNLQVNGIAVENTACASNGLVARDAVGLLLSCQNTVWKKAMGTFGGSFGVGTFSGACPYYDANPMVAGGCGCPSGTTAHLSGQLHRNSPSDQTMFICY